MTPAATPRIADDELPEAELWLYPDDSRILELSMKCLPAEQGVDTSGEQPTKTRRTLEFLSERLSRA